MHNDNFTTDYLSECYKTIIDDAFKEAMYFWKNHSYRYSAFDEAYKNVYSKKVFESYEKNFEILNELPEKQLIEELINISGMKNQRTYEYLKWRYQDFPRRKYFYCKLLSCKGFAILKKYKDTNNYNYLHNMDAFIKENDFNELLRAVDHIAKLEEVNEINFWDKPSNESMLNVNVYVKSQSQKLIYKKINAYNCDRKLFSKFTYGDAEGF